MTDNSAPQPPPSPGDLSAVTASLVALTLQVQRLASQHAELVALVGQIALAQQRGLIVTSPITLRVADPPA